MFYFCTPMQQRFIKIFFLIVALGIGNTSLFAQTKFTATIDPGTIGKDETAQLQFTVENGSQVESIDPPELKDFTIVGGPNQQSSMEIVNGVTTQSVGVSYFIQPKAVGTFTIPAAAAKVDGKILHSNSVTITVTAKPTGNTPQNNITNINMSPFAGFPGMDDMAQQNIPNDNILKKGENVQDKINKNIFIKAEANKTSCYVGEPVVVTYKSYSRLPFDITYGKSPAFNGFSMIDMTRQNNVDAAQKIEKLGGKDYAVNDLMKVQLYPLQAGKLNVGTFETTDNVHFIKEEYAQSAANDIFQNAMPADAMVNQQVTIKNNPVFITVKPLPDKDKPASFKGAVGNFTISSSIDKDSFSTDDAGKLSVTINGSGNMLLINSPIVSWPQQMESFDPKITDNLDKTQVPVTGSKQFDYTFTVQSAGKYMLPPVTFSFFDPKAETYKTVSTKPLSIIVTQGVKNIASTSSGPLSNYNNRSFFDKLSNIPLLSVELSALLALLALFFWFNRKKKRQDINITEKEEKPQQSTANVETEQPGKYLSLSEEKLLIHDSKGFYEALNKEVRSFLSAYLHILPEEINKKRIAEELDKRGISFITNLKVQQLIENIELQLYTPIHVNSQLEESFTNAKEMIYSLESIAR
jgi:oxygen tolerance protein BatD